MKKYFYTNGVDKLGPFSFEKLKEENLSRETKVWYYGLENWTSISELEEFNSISKSIPPQLNFEKKQEIQEHHKTENAVKNNIIFKKPQKDKLNLRRIFTIIVSLIVLLTVYFFYNRQKDNRFYLEISSTAYETDFDFNFYVDKFYRDLEVYGIFPKKPKKTIIMFAKLDQLDNATHIHGISYGMNDDDKIEIYINPSTWNKFNKPMRYYLMYHELAHDILNVDDLKDISMNKGELMFPAIAAYESKTMDDFIESSHALFEEISAKKK